MENYKDTKKIDYTKGKYKNGLQTGQILFLNVVKPSLSIFWGPHDTKYSHNMKQWTHAPLGATLMTESSLSNSEFVFFHNAIFTCKYLHMLSSST